jgi:hypothetical protein
MSDSEPGKNNPTRLPGLVGSRAVLVYSLIGAVFAPILLSMGMGGSIGDRSIGAVFTMLTSFWMPAVYLIGSLGIGRIARRWTGALSTRWVIELGIGLTLTLSLTHGLGVLGVLNPITAWIVTGIGCLLIGFDLRAHANDLNHSIGRVTATIPGIGFVVGCVLVVVMSLNPPGMLWDSEFSGYDALSYHLQLPREWLEAGRIWPSEHNVYSFLPGYFEGAYLHFAYLANAPMTTPAGLSGFLANDARVLMSTQLFSALLVIVSACASRSVARRAIALYLPDADVEDRSPGLCARVLMAGTPWIVVVGSLAYNEMGVVFLGIAALAVAMERDRSGSMRAIGAALLVGGACSVKPTALFLLGPAVGVVLLSTIPVRRWGKVIALGSIVGVLTLLPWLVRNEIATGNPVFPQLVSVFGDGHWSDAQHAIYADAHRSTGSLVDRFMLLFVPDPDGTVHVSRFRGLTNLQWGITPWIGVIGCLVLLAQQRTRRLGLVVAGAIALPMLAWMMLTHLQSRFLVPMTPMLIGAGVLGLASVPSATLGRGLIGAVSMVSIGWTILIATSQSSGNPFMLVDLGAGVFTGEVEVGNPPWTATLDTIAEPGETIYLLGDATAMYVRSPMVYNTVYDRWIIEEAIEAHPSDPALWTQTLRERGVDLVVVSFSELGRFASSGWLPKSIEPALLNEWINTLGEPIYVWTNPQSPEPIRAAFRVSK